jgi:hypothetical protein
MKVLPYSDVIHAYFGLPDTDSHRPACRYRLALLRNKRAGKTDFWLS